MDASGGLQHIFEHSLQETRTVFGTSSWKQIKPASQIRPIKQSSMIFGELHFKENSELPSHSFPISPFSSAILNHSSREDENNIGSSSNPKVLHKKNFSSNSESPQVCTEGLGSKSCDDAWDNDTTNEMIHEWQSSKDKIDEASGILNEKRGNVHSVLKVVKLRRSTRVKDFLPPISCIGKNEKPLVSFNFMLGSENFPLEFWILYLPSRTSKQDSRNIAMVFAPNMTQHIAPINGGQLWHIELQLTDPLTALMNYSQNNEIPNTDDHSLMLTDDKLITYADHVNETPTEIETFTTETDAIVSNNLKPTTLMTSTVDKTKGITNLSRIYSRIERMKHGIEGCSTTVEP
ncbi:hypothetical protein F3Y22_tig00110882pilonHSYRG00064 [Hibiscus syriacus]|uniref:Uncharacterized protein n=1 Tax=Hibiscus syriacus TaxID=106335 RepID=A0A6A2ZKN9_HIBSY|nr:hypothetical protein F3Y22_tig00110882pilonHSYRG00064 [Hibiscus syriacus]